MKTCSKCKIEKALTEFSPDKRGTFKVSAYCKPCNVIRQIAYRERNREKVRTYQANWRESNREDIRQKDRAKNKEIKKLIMDAYGGRCACCFEKDLAFLSIDHIDGSGAEKRRSGEHGHGRKFYDTLIKQNYPDGYQVLCFNCNFAKSNGGCPHQEGN